MVSIDFAFAFADARTFDRTTSRVACTQPSNDRLCTVFEELHVSSLVSGPMD